MSTTENAINAIMSAIATRDEPWQKTWTQWARRWLSGEDQTWSSCEDAARTCEEVGGWGSIGDPLARAAATASRCVALLGVDPPRKHKELRAAARRAAADVVRGVAYWAPRLAQVAR